MKKKQKKPKVKSFGATVKLSHDSEPIWRKFARVALTGAWSSAYSAEVLAYKAAKIADAMMAERERRLK